MLNDHIVDLSKKVNVLAVQRQIAKDSLEKNQLKIQNLIHSLQNHEIASAILLSVAKKTQQALAYRLSNLVSTCLSSVFDEPYTFEVSYVEKRGKTEVSWHLTRGGMSLDDPMLSTGGGVVDIVSFALRVACLSISTSPLRRVLILDEPFHFVHGRESQLKVGELVNRLSKELSINFIFVVNLEDNPVWLDTLEFKNIHVEAGELS